MMDITPLIPQGRQVVTSYGDNGFTISAKRYEGSILLFPDAVHPWDENDVTTLNLESLEALWRKQEIFDLLLIGCGPRMSVVPSALRLYCREQGVHIETMDTGAACRTYNVLLAEERRIAAALIAV